jgi:hypothetical protein
VIPVLFLRTSRSEPARPDRGLPEPVEAVTLHDFLEPETRVTEGRPVRPDCTSRKLRARTPRTASSKTTTHETDLAFVGDCVRRLIATTNGAVRSDATWRSDLGPESRLGGDVE